jgi:hypothetical protein
MGRAAGKLERRWLPTGLAKSKSSGKGARVVSGGSNPILRRLEPEEYGRFIPCISSPFSQEKPIHIF